MEFISKPLLEWSLARRIKAGRSRPCRKSDHCYAERKKYDVARKTAGDFRFDTTAGQEALAEGYTCLCPLYNCRYPSFRLAGKAGRWAVADNL